MTRQDCVTKWVINANGEKVWDGNELCRPVSWMNCTLHEEPKVFNQTYTRCARTGNPIPTMSCALRERTRMTTGFKCEVKHTVDCNCTHVERCAEIVYRECREVPRPLACTNTPMKVPYQPKIHRVKCLLADNSEAPAIDADESAQRADVELDIEDI